MANAQAGYGALVWPSWEALDEPYYACGGAHHMIQHRVIAVLSSLLRLASAAGAYTKTVPVARSNKS